MRKFLILVFLLFFSTGASAQQVFRIMPEWSGKFSSQIRLAPTYIDARVLAGGVAETATIPATVKWLIFSSACNFFAKIGASAAVPAADVTDGTASEQNPAAWWVEGSTQVTIISAGACIVTLSYYK